MLTDRQHTLKGMWDVGITIDMAVVRGCLPLWGRQVPRLQVPMPT